MKSHLAFSAALVALALPLTMPAWSAGGSGGGETTEKCKAGEVWDKDQQKCAPAKQGAIDDDSLFEGGRALAYAGRYGEAIVMLGMVADKSAPRVLNMLGFAHRKSGRIQVGLGYYQEALTADPDFVLAREYLGEAYLTLGDIGAARNQLTEIGKRCGTGCAEYAALERQIVAVTAGG